MLSIARSVNQSIRCLRMFNMTKRFHLNQHKAVFPCLTIPKWSFSSSNQPQESSSGSNENISSRDQLKRENEDIFNQIDKVIARLLNVLIFF